MILFAFIYFYQSLILTVHAKNPGDTMKLLSLDQVGVRIIGGEVTSIENYPFAVSVQRRYSSHFCGGTYVAPRFVLSAAHCMVRRTSADKWIPENPRRFYAIAGATYVYFPSSSSTQMELIDKTLPHTKFRFLNLQHDIGLFRTKKPFRINTYVQYVNLPPAYDTEIFTRYTDFCTVIGWGRIVPGSNEGSGTDLRHVKVPLIPTSECSVEGLHKKSNLCAGLEKGGRDACQGDSGGPLLCNNTQVGIVSWGEGCARPNSPGVYTRVDFYLTWINYTIKQNHASRANCDIHVILLSVLIHFTRQF